MSNIEVISALVISCTSLITAIGLCIRKLHIKKCKSCCMDVELGSTPSASLVDSNDDHIQKK